MVDLGLDSLEPQFELIGDSLEIAEMASCWRSCQQKSKVVYRDKPQSSSNTLEDFWFNAGRVSLRRA
jgi:hypothetical protein